MTTTSDAELLRKAAQLIDHHDWARYRYLDPYTGAMSLDYAIWKVARDGAHRIKLEQLVKAALGFPKHPHWDKATNRVTERRTGCLMRWNDDPWRTRYDVITALNDAARLAQKEAVEEALR